MKYLLDTNIVVFLLRGREEIARKIEKAGFENCFISEITKAELLAGYYKSILKGSASNPRLLDFLDEISVVPVSAAIDTYSYELARLQLDGKSIDDFDLLIACSAVAGNYTLVTDNISHLARVKGVVIENWVKRKV